MLGPTSRPKPYASSGYVQAVGSGLVGSFTTSALSPWGRSWLSVSRSETIRFSRVFITAIASSQLNRATPSLPSRSRVAGGDLGGEMRNLPPAGPTPRHVSPHTLRDQDHAGIAARWSARCALRRTEPQLCAELSDTYAALTAGKSRRIRTDSEIAHPANIASAANALATEVQAPRCEGIAEGSRTACGAPRR